MSERDTANRLLAEGISRIEQLAGNEVYRKAWSRAARVLKNLLVEFNNSVIDNHEQIGS